MLDTGVTPASAGDSGRRWFWFAAIALFGAMMLWPHAAFAQDAADPWMKYPTWETWFQQNSSCWGCTLFSSIAQATFQIGQQGSDQFSAGIIPAMTAFMGVWVMFQLYKMLSISHANSPAQGIDEIFNRLVLMVIITAIIKAKPYTYIMVGFVYPILQGIMGAAASFVGGGATDCKVDGGASMTGNGQAFVDSGVALMCGMHKSLEGGVALGAWLAYSAHLNPFTGPGIQLFQVLAGLIVFLAFCFMIIVIPFRFFDALVRIGTVAAILPFVVLSYLFKPTRGVVRSAVTSVLAAGLTFLFSAIAISIAIKIMGSVIGPVVTAAAGSDTPAGTTSPFASININQFMVLLTTAVGLATMVLQAGSIANEFAGFAGSMGNAGNVGAAMTGAAIAYGGRSAGAAAGRAGRGTARLGGQVASSTYNRWRAGSGNQAGSARDNGVAAGGSVTPGSAGFTESP